MKDLILKYWDKIFNRNYTPYCPICSGCGEDGCCSAIHCKQHPKGFYCDTYKKDLEFSYRMYRNLYKFVEDNNFSLDRDDFEKLHSDTWDEVFK